MSEKRTKRFPITWLLIPAFGTWIAVAFFVAAVEALPSTEWLAAFNVFWVASLICSLVVICAIIVALKMLYDSSEHRTVKNISTVISAPLVAGIGVLFMLTMLAPLSGCC